MRCSSVTLGQLPSDGTYAKSARHRSLSVPDFLRSVPLPAGSERQPGRQVPADFDVDENRILRAAVTRLAQMEIRSPETRRVLRALDDAFADVMPMRYCSRRVPGIGYSRLNARHRPAVELARRILGETSFDLAGDGVAADRPAESPHRRPVIIDCATVDRCRSPTPVPSARCRRSASRTCIWSRRSYHTVPLPDGSRSADRPRH